MIRRINELLQITRRGIGELGRKVVKEFTYPPESKVECNDTRELEIFELNKAVEILRNQALYGEICLCKDEFHAIESRIYKQLPECKTGEKDYTKTELPDKDAYIKANPYCVAYETWAEYLSAQCKRVKLDFRVIEKKCSDVDLDLHGTNFVTCDAIDLAIAIENKTCNVDIDPKVDLQQCVVDFVANVIPRGCDVSLETFVEKVSCGVDVKTILREVGCDVDINVHTGDPLCPSSSSLSPSASASPSEVCDFDYECATLAGCEVAEAVEYHYAYGNEELLQYRSILQATNRPTFTINCGACSFEIRPEFWEITTEFNGDSSASVINGSYDLSAGVAADACSDIDNAELYYYIQILPLSECGLICDEDYSDCITACLGDPTCEDNCSVSQDDCYTACNNDITLSVPSAECCSEGYSATLVSSSIPTSQAGYTDCGVSPANLLYYDFTWTFEDSLGNSITCAGRYYDVSV